MLRVRPVTPASRDDFEALFSSKGCPGFCWCAPYRFRDAHTMDRDAKGRAMLRRVAEGVPVGVLALDGEEPVGWCSVAPRSTYTKLATSTVMPTVDPDAWTLSCLFVRRDHRGHGAAGVLVEGALRYATAQGARVVEAYPWDTAGITSRHWGHSSLFKDAGFKRDGGTRRWVRRF